MESVPIPHHHLRKRPQEGCDITLYVVSRIGSFVLASTLMVLGCEAPKKKKEDTPRRQDRAERQEDQQRERELRRQGY